MSKTNPIKSTSVPSAYDTPLTNLEYLRKVESQNAQVLARQDEIEEALEGKVNKSGDTMTGTLNVPQANANTGVFKDMNVVSQDGKTHVEADNNGFVAEVNVPDLNKKFTFGVGSNGKVALNVHDVPNNRDTLFMFPNADDYGAGTFELATKNDIPSGGSSLLEDIEDEDGHKRFFNLNGTKGVDTDTYFGTFNAVASLSGYHLMVVLIMQKLFDKTILADKELAVFDIPSWIYDKIISLSNNGTVMNTTATIYSDSALAGTKPQYYLKKDNGQLKVFSQDQDTSRLNVYVRVQFDLYIE